MEGAAVAEESTASGVATMEVDTVSVLDRESYERACLLVPESAFAC